MKDVLLPLKSGSDSSKADQEAKELARQISLKAEDNASGKTTAESDLSNPFSLSDLQDNVPTTFQSAAASMSYAIQNPSGASVQQPVQPVAKNTSRSPRQRRAQPPGQRRSPASPETVIQGQQPRGSHTDRGRYAALFVILTLPLAALMFP